MENEEAVLAKVEISSLGRNSLKIINLNWQLKK